MAGLLAAMGPDAAAQVRLDFGPNPDVVAAATRVGLVPWSWSHVSRFDMAFGSDRRQNGHHALPGGVVGGIAGIVVGVVLGNQIRTSCEANCGGFAVAAAAVGAVVGAGAGALIGWAIPKR